MTLEINDRTYNYILELISQKKELNEKYDVLRNNPERELEHSLDR